MFRQKDFSKKNTIKGVGKYLAKHPLLPVSLTTLGISAANYRTNKKRQEEGKEYQEEHLKVIRDLNNNMIKNVEALNTVKDALGENSKILSDQRNNKEEKSKEKTNKRKGLVFRKKVLNLLKDKNYSIQEGGFKGRKIEPKKTSVLKGAAVGAGISAGVSGITILANPAFSTRDKGLMMSIVTLLGSGFGALATWLDNISRESIFNSGLSTDVNSYNLIKSLEDYYTQDEEEHEITTSTKLYDDVTVRKTIKRLPKKSTISPIGTLFSIDADPKKHVINLLLRGNVMVMLLNKPTTYELNKCNNILDNYCKDFKNADYTASKLDKNIYLVEINIVDYISTGMELVLGFIKSGFKVNILTTNRFGIKNK